MDDQFYDRAEQLFAAAPFQLTVERSELLIAAAMELQALREEVARLREPLKYYADQYCEGWCEGSEGTSDDCGGCIARVALMFGLKP